MREITHERIHLRPGERREFGGVIVSLDNVSRGGAWLNLERVKPARDSGKAPLQSDSPKE